MGSRGSRPERYFPGLPRRRERKGFHLTDLAGNLVLRKGLRASAFKGGDVQLQLRLGDHLGQSGLTVNVVGDTDHRAYRHLVILCDDILHLHGPLHLGNHGRPEAFLAQENMVGEDRSLGLSFPRKSTKSNAGPLPRR